MMSVLFINNTQETFTPTASGALATIIWECCRAARADGRQPMVMTRESDIPAFNWPSTIFVPYPRLPSDRSETLLFRAERKICGWRYLRQREYADRVIEEIRRHDLARLPIVLFNDPELVVELRHAFPQARLIHWFQNQQECKAKYRESFAAAVDDVAACSKFTARWIDGYYRLAPGRTRTLYNGVDARAFSPSGSEPVGPLVLNFVGRTGIEKGPDLLLKAAISLAARGRAFAVQLIGSNHWDRFELDSYQRQLVDLARELENKGIAVRRPGHIGRSALASELRHAHIHVVPARWDEPFGMTTIEGMACGLATVATRTGGTPEVVGNAALLVERESSEQLATAIDRLLLDADLRRDLALRGRRRAEEFSWSRAWNDLKALARAA